MQEREVELIDSLAYLREVVVEVVNFEVEPREGCSVVIFFKLFLVAAGL